MKAANIEHRIISIEVQNGTRGMEEFLGFVSYHRSYWNTAQGVKLAYPKWEKITNEDEKDTATNDAPREVVSKWTKKRRKKYGNAARAV